MLYLLVYMLLQLLWTGFLYFANTRYSNLVRLVGIISQVDKNCVCRVVVEKILSKFIILQSVVTRYLFVQKVVKCCDGI